MGYKSFQIFVDNPTGSYYAGSNVTGRVVLVLEKTKKVRGLQIKFEGSAKVSWTESESVQQSDGTTSDESTTYSSTEKYFSYKNFLIGCAHGEVDIPPGENVYPFSTTLPSCLPTSFDGEHGYVRYTIKATLDRPWKMNEKTEIFIHVVTPLDLNFLPHVKDPMLQEATKTFFSLFSKSGPLKLTGSIPYSGYVPGQTIVTAIEVYNNSHVHIVCVKCKLIKKVMWITPSKTQESTMTLVKFKLGGVPPNDFKSWSQNIDIPHMPFINLDACSIIKVEFYIELLASPSGAHRSLVNRLPIILGSVPLGAVSSYQMGASGPPPIGPAPLCPVFPTAPSLKEEETPPRAGFISY